MNAFVPYLAALHLQELLDEARLDKRAKLSEGSQPKVPAWRRSLGSGARGLSGVLASAARSLDPVTESDRSARRTRDGGVDRALAS